MADPKAVLAHLLTTVLEIDPADITALTNKGGFRTYTKYCKVTDDKFELLYKSNHITLSCWIELQSFRMYIDENSPSYDDIIAMDADDWAAVDTDMLRLNHSLRTALLASPVPTITTTADTVMPAQIQATNFLKYVHVTLKNKHQILNFYSNLVTQSEAHNVFLTPSDKITALLGAEPQAMKSDSRNATATVLYTKFCQTDTIDPSYKDAQSLLEPTTDGYVFLQLLLQQVHPLLMIETVAVRDIPRYSTFKNLFTYAKAIRLYVNNHALQHRLYSDKEVTNIFLSHLDGETHAPAVKEVKAALLLSSNVSSMYLVPAIASTIEQLTPALSTPHHGQIRSIGDYIADDDTTTDDYCQYAEGSMETPFVRSLRYGGGRSPHSRNNQRSYGGRGRGRSGAGRGGRPKTNSTFKGKCRACGQSNHHADSCYFLMKLREALTYLNVDHEAAHKKRVSFKGKNSYSNNRSYARSLIDAGFIPFPGADADNFIDIVDTDHSVFEPDIINSTADDFNNDDEDE